MSALTSDSGRATSTPGGGLVADLAFTDLADLEGPAGIDREEFRASQVAAVIGNVPVIMAANVVAVGLLFWLVRATPGLDPLTIWGGAMVLASGVAWLLAVKFGGREPTPWTVEKIAAWAVLFAVLWALLPVACFRGSEAGVCLLVIGIVMAVGGLGACSLARVPSAALLFTAIVTTAIAASSQGLDGRIGLAMLLFTATYGAALAVIIVSAHKSALRHAADAAELERQRETIKLLLKDFEAGASDWLWETGPGGELVYVSDRLAQVLRRDHPRLLGAKLHQAASMAQTASGWRTLAVLMARHEPVRDLEVPVRRKGATMWWQLNARPLYDASGAFCGYRGVGSDVTAKRETANQMLRAREAAERASAAKSRFLATISHELRTPLNAVVGFSEIIADQREGPIGHAAYADYARSILDSSRHLATLISDILDISRFENGSASVVDQEVDVIEVAEVVVKMCRDAARANDIVIVEDFGVDPVEVRGEITRLQQIMFNLVNNALKFTPAGGTVQVALARDQRGGLEFIVSDNGIGIPKRDLKRIFEPFVQADDGPARRFGGIGLGLAISRMLARLHDGDVVITSRPGKGTVAKLVLPPSRLVQRRRLRATAAA